MLAGDLLIVNGDSESDPFLFGLDKLTGKTVWKTDRPAREGYSTPVLLTVGDHTELVLNGDPFVAGYDPATGKELWSCKSFAGRGEPTPAVGKDAVYVVNGLPADVYAVKPGGKGDVTRSHLLWHTSRHSGRDGPSPILADGLLFVSNMAGIGTCYDAATGKQLWQEPPGGGKMSASPIVAGGRVYFLFEDGAVAVVEPGKEPKVSAANTIDAGAGEIFRALPAAVGGQLFLRSDQTLYCIGKGKP